MTPDVLLTNHLPRGCFDRLQTWVGVDRETEWFTVPHGGVDFQVAGVALHADPGVVEASATTGEIRLRAMLLVRASEARVRIEATLAEGGMAVLRDAFGAERVQLLPGSPRLHADLGPGRYAIDAVLPADSKILLAFVEPRRADAVRSRVG